MFANVPKNAEVMMENEPWKWEEADLLNLIQQGVKESLELDYKRCDSLKMRDDTKANEVSKDVSAFANSAGGTIVYGLVEENHLPTRIDVGYDPNQVTKEWLQSVINSRIQQKIDGIRINPVDLKTTAPGRVAYVVHIPQSMRAPHQASDHKFYKRHEFISEPMKEYEIRDVARRSEAPDLKVIFEVGGATKDVFEVDGVNSEMESVLIYCVVTNDSPVPVEYGVFDILLDSRLNVGRNFGESFSPTITRISMSGQDFACRTTSKNWNVPAMMPIFKGVRFRLVNPFGVLIPEPGSYLLGAQIRAPRMEPKMEGVTLNWDGKEATINQTDR